MMWLALAPVLAGDPSSASGSFVLLSEIW